MNNDKSWGVIRGGYSGDARGGRVASRYRFDPSNRYDNLGFRLSRVINPLQQLSEVINEKG